MLWHHSTRCRNATHTTSLELSVQLLCFADTITTLPTQLKPPGWPTSSSLVTRQQFPSMNVQSCKQACSISTPSSIRPSRATLLTFQFAAAFLSECAPPCHQRASLMCRNTRAASAALLAQGASQEASLAFLQADGCEPSLFNTVCLPSYLRACLSAYLPTCVHVSLPAYLPI